MWEVEGEFVSHYIVVSTYPISPRLTRTLQPSSFVVTYSTNCHGYTPLKHEPGVVINSFSATPYPRRRSSSVVILPRIGSSASARCTTGLISRGNFSRILLLNNLNNEQIRRALTGLYANLKLRRHNIHAALLSRHDHVACIVPNRAHHCPGRGCFFFSTFPVRNETRNICRHNSCCRLASTRLATDCPLNIDGRCTTKSSYVAVSAHDNTLIIIRAVTS